MKTLYKALLILNSAFCISNLSTNAQTTITFDSNDYKAVGVYDNWEGSPFRNGTLKGNAAVIANPNTAEDPILKKAPDATPNVVALQRSRFGSNTFGVRIDLNEPFRVTKANQYIHVMTLIQDKPTASKMMVIGLGKRVEEEWAWQNGEDEQFWALTSTDIEASESWQDIVCSFKGFSYSTSENPNSGIDIYSLVIVPDVRSTHADAQDWVAYFDEIVIDNNSSKRFSTSKYPLNFETTQKNTHGSRKLTQIGLTVGDETQSADVDGSYTYNNKVMTTAFSLTKGQSVVPTFKYSGTWMSGYAYVDWNCDGMFDDSEIVSQQPTGNQIQNAMPAFQIPTDIENGLYRMRYKVDWSSTDPGGNASADNLIYNNGGAIVDVMLDIHEADVSITANQLNGDMLSKNGEALQDYKAPYGEDFKIKPQPAPGFVYNGMTLKYGYNLTENQMDKNGNPNWYSVDIEQKDGEFITVPGEYIRGGAVYIEANMKSMTVSQQLEMYIEKAENAYGQKEVDKKLITENSQFSSPYTESNEGSLDNLLDGDLTTFWHSAWSGGSVAAGIHYLQIELPDGTMGDLELVMGRRDNASTTINDDHLTKAKIAGTNTKGATTATDIATIELPFVSQKEYVSADFRMNEAYKYIRIIELETNNQQRGYWHCGEVQLYTLKFLRDKAGDKAQALLDAINTAKAVTDPTQEDVDALVAAYNAYLAALEDPDPTPTAINATRASNTLKGNNNGIYDLSGHRLSSIPNQGIAIVNGKKNIYK